jgi:hypothetical protein
MGRDGRCGMTNCDNSEVLYQLSALMRQLSFTFYAKGAFFGFLSVDLCNFRKNRNRKILEEATLFLESTYSSILVLTAFHLLVMTSSIIFFNDNPNFFLLFLIGLPTT